METSILSLLNYDEQQQAVDAKLTERGMYRQMTMFYLESFMYCYNQHIDAIPHLTETYGRILNMKSARTT